MAHNICSQVQQSLERHLVVSDRAYTMADLKAMGDDIVVLPTIRDQLKLKIKEIGKGKLSATFNRYDTYYTYVSLLSCKCLSFLYISIYFYLGAFS